MWRQPPTTSRLVLAWRIALLAAPAALTMAAGLVTILRPPPSVADEASPLLRWAWSAALIVGGLSVLVGMCRRRMRPQLAGQALASAAVGTYALYLLGVPNGLVAAALLAASSLGALGEVYRHVDLARWARVDRDRSRRRHPASARRDELGGR